MIDFLEFFRKRRIKLTKQEIKEKRKLIGIQKELNKLLEEEKKYGGVRPRRTYNGFRYQPGYSDHLPVVTYFAKER